MPLFGLGGMAGSKTGLLGSLKKPKPTSTIRGGAAGRYEGRGFGLSPSLLQGARRRNEQRSQLIGAQATNQVAQGFSSRGIPAAAILNATQRGARAQTGAAGELGAGLDIAEAQAGQQGAQFGAGLDVRVLDIMRRRQDAIQAAKAGKQKGFSTPFGGVTF